MRYSRQSLVTASLAVTISALFAGCATSSPGAKYFSDWPEGTSPNVVGKRVVENFLPRQFRYETGTNTPARGPGTVIYPEVVCWYGALTFADVSHDQDLEQRLIKKFDRFLTPEGYTHVSQAATVDTHVFGAVPLEIFLLTKDQRYLDIGKKFADNELDGIFLPTGYSKEARFWADDLYMLPLVQVQAYRATGNLDFIELPAQLFADYLDKLQQPNGLFFHGETAKYYWGRGNGWAAAGLAEMLTKLPTTDKNYNRIMTGYKLMMSTLLKDQGEDGLWRQLIDHPEAYPETSGSAMFTFAIITGVKNGWLDPDTYGPAARKGWLGLVKYIDANANIANVCIGTNQWMPPRAGGPARPAAPARPGTAAAPRPPAMDPDPLKYYLTRPVVSGDQLMTADELHGNAPVLWCATALLR